MTYVGKKPADIIATAVDTTTGTFSGEVDAGSLDVSGNADIDGITNLDNTDIDGTLDVSGDLTVDTNTLFVDSANNRVGVGTVSPSTLLMVEPSARTTNFSASDFATYADILVKNPTNDSTCATGIAFITDASTYTNGASGIACISGSGDSESSLAFITRPNGAVAAEAMRIDSSGNVLVGKTSTGAENVGITLGSTGYASFTRDSNIALFLNRETNDGTIAEFRKDNTAVGSIGVYSTDLVITSTDDIFFNVAGASNNILQLYGGSGANSQVKFDSPVFPFTDNTRDLGNSTERWQNLYLSGGVYLGGTGSANKLDDYETGTWTPTVNGYSGTATFANATYTKVGDLVHVTVQVSLDGTSDGSSFQVRSLPFTSMNTTNSVFGGGVSWTNSSFSNNIYILVSSSNTQFTLYQPGDSLPISYTNIGANKTIRMFAIYRST